MPTLDQQLKAVADAVFDRRDERYRTITTPAQVTALQAEIRAIARDSFGPATLALDTVQGPPKVLRSGEVRLDGIVIEKFLYEALPDFWVPAVLYRPARPLKAGERRPAMVLPVGHWWEGKNNEMYQRLMRLMARRGVICASFDDCG
ncbi:MAG: hypothetical protein ACREJ2_14690, partial [Planctomycetota bacterium]